MARLMTPPAGNICQLGEFSLGVMDDTQLVVRANLRFALALVRDQTMKTLSMVMLIGKAALAAAGTPENQSNN